MMTLRIQQPQPKQQEFLTATEKYICYGGARGGGKSWAVRVKPVLLALAYPGITILMLRRTHPELYQNHVLPLIGMLKGIAKYNTQHKIFFFSNGSKIIMGYCATEKDVLQYQGNQYDIIIMDEATQFSEYQYQALTASLRGANNFPKRFYLTCNPGGVGHAWVKRLFITREYRGSEQAGDYRFIKATVYDNPALLKDDPDYVRKLENLPHGLREAWLLGDWDVFAGQFFTEWSRDVHVCEPFEVPKWWRWYFVMDYGLDMLAGYLIAVDEEGNAFVVSEIYEGNDLGEGHSGVLVSDAAVRIKTLCAGRSISEYLAPPDLWNAKSDTGKSTADQFAEEGIYLSKTGNDRVSGWLAVKERLKVRAGVDGNPTARLKIFPKCVNLIRTLPLLQYDERRTNDCMKDPHELTHAPDAIRYFCSYWVGRSGGEPAAPKPEKLINKLQKRNTGSRYRRM